MKKAIVLVLICLMTLTCFASCDKIGRSSADDDAGDSLSQKAEDDGVGDALDTQEAILEDTPEDPIIISVSDAEVSKGDVFNITVSIDNEEWSWCSFEFVIQYDPSVIKITDARATEFTENMIPMNNLEYKDDAIRIAYISADDLQGGGDILEIECEALEKGSFEMVLSEEFMYRFVTLAATGEYATREIPLVLESGEITVK